MSLINLRPLKLSRSLINTTINRTRSLILSQQTMTKPSTLSLTQMRQTRIRQTTSRFINALININSPTISLQQIILTTTRRKRRQTQVITQLQLRRTMISHTTISPKQNTNLRPTSQRLRLTRTLKRNRHNQITNTTTAHLNQPSISRTTRRNPNNRRRHTHQRTRPRLNRSTHSTVTNRRRIISHNLRSQRPQLNLSTITSHNLMTLTINLTTNHTGHQTLTHVRHTPISTNPINNPNRNTTRHISLTRRISLTSPTSQQITTRLTSNFSLIHRRRHLNTNTHNHRNNFNTNVSTASRSRVRYSVGIRNHSISSVPTPPITHSTTNAQPIIPTTRSQGLDPNVHHFNNHVKPSTPTSTIPFDTQPTITKHSQSSAQKYRKQ